MAANDTDYPSAIDSFGTIGTAPVFQSAEVNGRKHRNLHNAMARAIEALETRLGKTVGTPTTIGHILRVTATGETTYGFATAANIAAPATGLVLDRVGPLVSAQTNIDFTPPTSNWECLEIEMLIRSTAAITTGALYIRFNSDSSSIYDQQLTYGNNTTNSALSAAAQDKARVGMGPGSSAPSNVFAHVKLDIPFYRLTTPHKLVTSEVTHKAANATTDLFRSSEAAWWRSAAAITGIRLFMSSGNFEVGSIAVLRGRPA